MARTGIDWNSQIGHSPIAGVPEIWADGIHNDAPAIQAVINSLAAGDGGTILLPPGPILLSGNGTELLNFPGPATVNLVGQGWSLNGGSYANTRFVVDASVPNTTDVIRIKPGVSTNGITGMYVGRFAIISQLPASAGRHGINIDSTNVYIKNLTIDDIYIGPISGRGIVSTNPTVIEGFYRSVIQDSWIYGGIRFERLGDSIHILRNDIWGPSIGMEILSVDPGAGHFDFDNNVVTTGAAFMYIGNSIALATIRDNFFEAQVPMAGSNGAAIDFDCPTLQGFNIQFTGNSVNLAAFSINLVGLRINNVKAVTLRDNFFARTPSTGGVDWLTTSAAVDTYVDRQYYSPNTDVYPATWTDAGTGTMVETRCEAYTINGSQLTSASNTQTINLFVHPLGAVISGARVKVTSPLGATNILTLTASVGDAGTIVDQFQTAVSVLGAAGVKARTNPVTSTTNYSATNVTVTFVGTYSAGGNFSTNPVSGAVEIDICWSLQPMTGEQ